MLSIIVPVYNSEKYLKKCLDSIKDIPDSEIVIINDGSSDNSEEIINTYLRECHNISYYKKENTGIADTRNFGIAHANGDYLMFVDSDDFISANMLSNLKPYMQKGIDLIKFKLQRVDESGNLIEKISGAIFEGKTGEEAFEVLYPTDVLLDSPCTYLFRTNYIRENNFKFEVGTYHEDFGLIPIMLIKAKSVVSKDLYIYNYVQSTNSITRNEDYSKTVKKMNDVLIQYDRMLKQITGLSNRAKENIKIYYTNAILLKLKELQPKEQESFIIEVKKRKMIQNIKIRNLKQLIKRLILTINIKMYLNMR